MAKETSISMRIETSEMRRQHSIIEEVKCEDSLDEDSMSALDEDLDSSYSDLPFKHQHMSSMRENVHNLIINRSTGLLNKRKTIAPTEIEGHQSLILKALDSFQKSQSKGDKVNTEENELKDCLIKAFMVVFTHKSSHHLLLNKDLI